MHIENKLKTFFMEHLHHLQVVNESHRHSVPHGSETHFRIEIVSDLFLDTKILERHRLVNSILKNEFAKIKAFSLHTATLGEWQRCHQEFEKSPGCAGGSKS